MLELESTNLEAQRNIAMRKPELQYEQEVFAMNNFNLYDTMKKNVTNESAFRKFTLQFSKLQWLYPHNMYAAKNRKNDYNTDLLTLGRLGEEMYMDPGKTYPDYERKMRIEEQETRAKSPERLQAEEQNRKAKSEDQLSLLTNDAIFSLADGEGKKEGYLEKDIQSELNEFKYRSDLFLGEN